MSVLKLSVKHGKDTYEISAEQSSLVADIMQQIEQLTEVFVKEQKLVCQGKVLNPSSSLEASKIKSGAKLMLLAGGGQTKVRGLCCCNHIVQMDACAALLGFEALHPVQSQPCAQGQVAAQQIIREKAAAAKQRADLFRQKQQTVAHTQTPKVSMQVEPFSKTWRCCTATF